MAKILMPGKSANAMGGGFGASAMTEPLTRQQIFGQLALFGSLFSILSTLHAAEIAITTLYPWKVREFAEEEGPGGTFTILNEDITKILITILVTGTACSIYATTLFTTLWGALVKPEWEKYGAIVLTSLTLYFVELLPKSLGVLAAEKVARLFVPPLNLLSKVVGPLGNGLNYFSKSTLKLFGFANAEGAAGVSDSELRLIVTGALDSGTITAPEQEMISGVLNLQNLKIREIMKPRVEVTAVPDSWSVAQVLNVVRESGYSRIPVYHEEIDNIVGIVFAKSVLDFFVRGVVGFGQAEEELTNADGNDVPVESVVQVSDTYVKANPTGTLSNRLSTNIQEANLVEPAFFIPETADGWTVLEEMRRRRVHVGIVVDEYGGTEGLVSLEDIVEEIVGEIYDEDDTEDFTFSEDSIEPQPDGSFIIRGDAELEDVDTVLDLQLEEDVLKEFGTFSGYLCSVAGEIPCVDDFIMTSCGDSGDGWLFEFIEADEKRLLSIRVSPLLKNEIDSENTVVKDDIAINGTKTSELIEKFYLESDEIEHLIKHEQATDHATLEEETTVSTIADVVTSAIESEEEAESIERLAAATEIKLQLVQKEKQSLESLNE